MKDLEKDTKTQGQEDFEPFWRYSIRPSEADGYHNDVTEWRVRLESLEGDDDNPQWIVAGEIEVTIIRDWSMHEDIPWDERISSVWDCTDEMTIIGEELIKARGGLKKRHIDLTYKTALICFSDLNIEKKFRRRGGAYFLVQSIIRALGHENAAFLTVINQDNKRSTAFWKSMKFKHIQKGKSDTKVLILRH